MTILRQKLETHPIAIRVAPFVFFVVLTALQGRFGEASAYWIYVAKTLLVVPMLWCVWPLVREMRWAFSWEAVAVGVGVFALWVGLDAFYPKFGDLDPNDLWNPFAHFGDGASLAWLIVGVRIAGSVLVVPLLEEVFYRSFLYRYLTKADFLSMPLNQLNVRSLAITALVFGFAHYEWLAGILCGLAYHWLILRKGRLGDAMTAHAITNLLLGIWVVWKGAWEFW